MLRDLVVRATKSADGESKYAVTAITMLSYPLPKGVTLPSEVQYLFVQAFEHAAKEPSVLSIKPIYQMLQGTSTLLLGLLPSNVLFRFEEQLLQILHDIRGDNQPLCLYCLAIMKITSTASERHLGSFSASYDTQELLASSDASHSQWTSDTINQFFSEGKAQKTMQLVVLRTTWACKTTTGESLDEKLESLMLANEVITSVPVEIREAWRKSNALIVRKLEEKIHALELEAALHLPSLCFLLHLTEGHVHPATAVDRLRQMVTNLAQIGNENDLGCLIRSNVFDQRATTTFIQNFVDFITSASLQDVVEQAGSLGQLLQQLSEAMPEHEAIIEGIMLAIDVLSCGQKLHSLSKLVLSPSPSLPTLRPGLCYHAASDAMNGLVHSLCKVFLPAALSSRNSTYSVSAQTLALLLQLHASSAQISQPCSHVKHHQSRNQSGIAFSEALGTPDGDSRDWRKALQSHFQKRGEAEQDAITTLFAKSCAELEARCHNVEQPLREEREKTEALQQQYDDLNHAIATMESENIDRNIQFHALEMERDRCMEDLEAAQSENTALTERADDLELRLQQTSTETYGTISELRLEMEMLELNHAAALAKKEELAEDLQERMDDTNNELNQKTEELKLMGERKDDLDVNVISLKTQIQDATTSKDQLSDEIERLSRENFTLSEQLSKQDSEVERLKQEMNAAQQAHELRLEQLSRETNDREAALVSSNAQNAKTAELQYEKDKADLSKQLEDLKVQHQEAIAKNEEAIKTAVEHHEGEKATLTKQIEDLSERHQHLENAHATEVKRLEKESRQHQKQIDRLQSKCEQKEKQIAEANAMRSNLMAAMGISGETSKQTSLPHRPSAFSSGQTQSQDVDTQTDPSPPTPHSGNEEESQQQEAAGSFVSNASTDSRSGPTPKRARPRRSVKTSPPVKSRMSASTSLRTTRRSTATNGTAKRQPLSSMSANQEHRKSVAPKTPSKVNSKTDENDADETTFEGSELFTGTPGQRMLDLDGACG